MAEADSIRMEDKTHQNSILQGQSGGEEPLLKSPFEGAVIGSREWEMGQAVASAMIEGYVPNPEFLSDAKLLCKGLISDEVMTNRIKGRALGRR